MGLDEDFALALALENEIVENVPYNKNKLKPESSNNVPVSTSLADPSWELVDPTPDIFALFIAFDLRFFWGKLKSVVVRWSKRMYSCAGICSYVGRSGMCTVSLSEPLLKLRPRKDLVETLLHEMIHAFLFVTHNNKDRDGHGPEFHKHMHRINSEAGINITVYHSFYDEVNLYKTHWWRCNGPCRSKAPYFGTVKRSSNRAPGPSDFWWKQHQANCGGTWEKIKEPETVRKKQVIKPSDNIHGLGDITKYVKKGNKGMTSNRGGTLVITKLPVTKTKVAGSNTPTKPTQTSLTNFVTQTNIKTGILKNSGLLINSKANNNIGKPISNNASGNLLNVKGFKDLNIAATPHKPLVTFGDAGNILGSAKVTNLTIDLTSHKVADTVRNHWDKKYNVRSAPDSKENSFNKRRKISNGFIEIKDDIEYLNSKDINKNVTNKKISSNLDPIVIEDEIITNKIGKKIADSSASTSIIIDDDSDDDSNKKPSKSVNDELELKPYEMKVNCPICRQIVNEKYINEHLDVCMISGSSSSENDKPIIINDDLENDLSLVSEFSGDDLMVQDFINESNEPKSYSVKCPMCNTDLNSSELAEHLNRCNKIDFSQNMKGSGNSCSDNGIPIVINHDLENDVCIISESSGNDLIIEDFRNKSIEEKARDVKCPICKSDVNNSNLCEHLKTCDETNFTQNTKEFLNSTTDLDTISMLKDIGYSSNEIKNYMKKNESRQASTSRNVNSNMGVLNLVQNIDKNYLNESVNVNFVGGKQVDDDNEDYLGNLSQSEEVPNNFPCPVCFKFISLEDMNSHLDTCLSV